MSALRAWICACFVGEQETASQTLAGSPQTEPNEALNLDRSGLAF